MLNSFSFPLEITPSHSKKIHCCPIEIETEKDKGVSYACLAVFNFKLLNYGFNLNGRRREKTIWWKSKESKPSTLNRWHIWLGDVGLCFSLGQERSGPSSYTALWIGFRKRFVWIIGNCNLIWNSTLIVRNLRVRRAIFPPLSTW